MNSLSPSKQMAQEIKLEVKKFKELLNENQKARCQSERPALYPKTNHFSSKQTSYQEEVTSNYDSSNEQSNNSPKSVGHQTKYIFQKNSENAKPKKTFKNMQENKKCVSVTKNKASNAKQKQQEVQKDILQMLISKAQSELENCTLPLDDKTEGQENSVHEKEDSFLSTVREAKEKTGNTAIQSEILSGELEKWRQFGYLLAESYDQLKKNYNQQLTESGKFKQIIKALKDQVGKLKALLTHKTSENENLLSELANEENIREDYIRLKNEFENLQKENIELKKGNHQLMTQISASEKQIEILGNEKLLNEKLVQQLNEKIKVIFFIYLSVEIKNKNSTSSSRK